MLSVYVPGHGRLERVSVEAGALLPDKAVWLDLVAPRAPEDRPSSNFSASPSQEIEVSSRLYIENGARYMTTPLMCRSDSDAPRPRRRAYMYFK